MTHAKPQSLKGKEILPFFAPLRLCVRKILFPSFPIWRFVTRECFMDSTWLQTAPRLTAGLLLVTGFSGCVLPVNIYTSPKVTGCVYDKKTQMPVSEATVTFAGLPQIAARTDGKGDFSLPEHKHRELVVFLGAVDPPTSITLIARHKDYRDFSSRIPLRSPSEGLKIFLQPYKP